MDINVEPHKKVMLKHIKIIYSRWPWTTLQTNKLNWIENLYNMHILFRLAYILQQLEFVHFFIKFAQMKDVFVCNLMATI
jgi:hypothetical protein